MKIAYCFLVHRAPGQVRRLIDRVHRSDDLFYVDIFNNENKPKWDEALAPFEGDNFTVVRKYSNGWGSFKLVEATLDAMRFFRERDYDYFINLSGQCYPLRPIEDIKRRLEANEGKGFMEYEALPRARWVDENGGYDRFFKRCYQPFKYREPYRIPRLRRALPRNMRPYGGSQWFTLHRDQVDYVLDLIESDPEIVRFFRRTRIPDELFFQTILMNSPLKGDIVNDNRRFIDWFKLGVPTPAVLLSEDYDRLVRSGKDFARKFEPEMDADILDMLDRRILRQEVERPQERAVESDLRVPVAAEVRR